MDAFVALPDVAEVLEHGATKGSIRHREGIQVDLRVMEPECFGAALLYFTGSKQHNIRIREMAVRKGLKLSEYGLFRESSSRRLAGATEEEVYAAIGLPWIPPELREDAGEVEVALARRLPGLVTLGDIRGDLHCHTKASDGHATIEALVTAARQRGYEYVVVSDHSRSRASRAVFPSASCALTSRRCERWPGSRRTSPCSPAPNATSCPTAPWIIPTRCWPTWTSSSPPSTEGSNSLDPR
jgi:DNA polymerase (family X)